GRRSGQYESGRAGCRRLACPTLHPFRPFQRQALPTGLTTVVGCCDARSSQNRCPRERRGSGGATAVRAPATATAARTNAAAASTGGVRAGMIETAGGVAAVPVLPVTRGGRVECRTGPGPAPLLCCVSHGTGVSHEAVRRRGHRHYGE